MFDVGFSELMLIAVVALVVIGPERLPGVARTVGHLFGRLQRYVNDVKADISREMELEDLKKFKNQFEEAAQSFESSVRSEVASAEKSINAIAAEVYPEYAPVAASPAAATAVPGTPDTVTNLPAAVMTESATPGAVGEPDAPAGATPAAASPESVQQKTAV